MEHSKPIVTVVTATYRNFDHLPRTMRSVFSQTYPNIHYIITDDGSPDFEKDYIDDQVIKMNKNRIDITVLHHKENMGTVKNLNYAYKCGKGEYIINLSCGDAFFDDYVIDRIVCRFETTPCDVLVTTRILYRNDFEPICLLPHYDERNIIYQYKDGIDQYKAFIIGRFYDMASGSAMHFRKRIFEQIGYYDEKYKLWEDGPFLARYLQVSRLEYAYDIVSIWYEAGGVSDYRDKKKKQKISGTALKLFEDTRLFNAEDKLDRIDLFSFAERRMIRYRNLRFLYSFNNSLLRYLLYIFYFPEVISNLKYANARKQRYITDQKEITRILIKNER